MLLLALQYALVALVLILPLNLQEPASQNTSTIHTGTALSLCFWRISLMPYWYILNFIKLFHSSRLTSLWSTWSARFSSIKVKFQQVPHCDYPFTSMTFCRTS
jgi:hypothetical protein